MSKEYDGAVEKCQFYGMSLYNVDDLGAKKALLDFLDSRFRPSNGDVFYIEGKTSEGCAVVANWNGLFDVSFVDCFWTYYFHCQFVRTPKTDEPGSHRANKT
jgi:hypothetical protein